MYAILTIPSLNFSIENFPPEILGPSVLNVTINQSMLLVVEAKDDQDDILSFSVLKTPNGTTLQQSANTLTLMWLPNSHSDVSSFYSHKHSWALISFASYQASGSIRYSIETMS